MLALHAVLGYTGAMPHHVSTRSVQMSDAASKWSMSLPFLSRPEALNGKMVGDVGFDPVGFSSIDGEYINLKWMREAELKHGRVAMLAALGWFMVDIGFHLPGDKYAGLTSLTAHTPMVTSGDMTVMLFIVALVEAKMGEKIFEPDHTPGDYGWDPLDLAKDDNEIALKELKNGRLAMLAFSGIVTQAALSGRGFPYF